MLISIVIPAYNEENNIGNTIDKIRGVFDQMKVDFEWEIIVCDNNSKDKTAEVASQHGARTIFEPINQISRARNTGASIATGDWLLFIDADSYPTVGLMEDTLHLIEKGEHIGCGCTVEVISGTKFNKVRMERLNPFYRLFKQCGGVFILVEREAFIAIEGFSERLYAYEEFNFIENLKKHGRSQGKKFSVLHKNPVQTSGRKGEIKFSSIFTLIFSQVFAILFLLIHWLLPENVMEKYGRKLLGYWYKDREESC
ncbi:MAG: glycosyltransferase [Bacteroidota bacterium]